MDPICPACTKCLGRAFQVKHDATERIWITYRCPDCNHEWTTLREEGTPDGLDRPGSTPRRSTLLT
ncbi:MAG: hypothetical protein ABI634_10820 [Acidobacteriota bacterium]